MLNVVSFSDARKIIDEKLTGTVGSVGVGIDAAAGRVTVADTVSRENVPSFDRSTVDGYAVRASDTFGAGESIPAILSIKKEILMGENAGFSIGSGECAKISTGGMLPEGADAVVMVENTDCGADGLCLVYKAVCPFENVTKKGDDVRENAVVIPGGTLLGAPHIGVLAALGIDTVEVAAKPVVAVISTGDEVTDISEAPAAGQIRDVNSYLISALVEECGCEAVRCGIFRDSYDEIFAAVRDASEKYDAVLISGGSSAGTRDMTVDIISKLGEVYAHGVAMKPGKPTIIGKIGTKPVFGLPGHPAAAFFVTLTLVAPMLEKLGGRPHGDFTVTCPLASNVSSNHGREEFLCVKLENGTAVPNYAKSGIISMLTKSDGYIVIDRNTEGVKMGETVTVHLFR